MGGEARARALPARAHPGDASRRDPYLTVARGDASRFPCGASCYGSAPSGDNTQAAGSTVSSLSGTEGIASESELVVARVGISSFSRHARLPVRRQGRQLELATRELSEVPIVERTQPADELDRVAELPSAHDGVKAGASRSEPRDDEALDPRSALALELEESASGGE